MMLALCFLVAMTPSVCEGQAQFPDVPESHLRGKGQDQVQQIRDLMDELTRRGVVQVPFKGRGPSPGLRYEAAVMIHAAYQAFFHDPKVKHRLGVDYVDVVASVRRAAATLEKELSSMGVDVAAMKLHLRALALSEGFPDVPPTHWALKATRELKGRGLLKGYPDGLFRGE